MKKKEKKIKKMFTDEEYRKNTVFKPCNFVITTYIDTSINLKFMSELITLLPIEYKINNKKNNREKIPFFGVDKSIIGLSFGTERRGIRKGGGTMKGCLGIDIQCFEKNVHIKVTKENFNVMGVSSEDMARQSSIMLLSHMVMVNNLWKKFLNMSEENKKKCISFLYDNIISDELLMYDDELFVNKLNELDGDIKTVVKYLSMFTYDYPTIELFKEKIERLLFINTTSFEKDNPIVLERYKIGNAVYNYKLGVELYMVQLCLGLKDRGYEGVLYENWHDPTKCNVMIPLSVVSDDEIITKKNKIQSHRFQINQCGAIRQTSPTDVDTALQVRNMLLRDIYDIVTKKN